MIWLIGEPLSNSYGTNFNGEYYYLRPVVSLKANIKLGTGDGSEEAPYQIANSGK